MPKINNLQAIDLFSGAGGMSLGFEQAGFNVIAAIDVDPIHISTYKNNFPYCCTICADVSQITGKEIFQVANLGKKELDLLFGGPPCNGFSLMGKRKFKDPRNQLLLHFARLVKELSPKYFVMENVNGLLIEPMNKILELFIEKINKSGYSIVNPIKTLNASEFGVPQNRKRLFMLGYKNGLSEPKYPDYSLIKKMNICTNVKVRDAICDLPNIDIVDELFKYDIFYGKLKKTKSNYAKILRGDIKSDFDRSNRKFSNNFGLTGCHRTKHNTETVKRFNSIFPGTVEPISRFYRLSMDGLCPTLRAGAVKEFGSFTAPRPIHPLKPRCITIREGARLHSYPDSFNFHHTIWHGFRQIGNSVPPFLARLVAESIYEVLQ